MDWRPQEFNSAANHLANCVLQSAGNIDTIDQRGVEYYLRRGIALQVFCDGGYERASRRGAAAFVVAGIKYAGNELKLSILGGRGIWIEGVRSAFQAEGAALDEATQYLFKLVQSCEHNSRKCKDLRALQVLITSDR